MENNNNTNRPNCLLNEIQKRLKHFPVKVCLNNNDVLINNQELLICGIGVEEYAYKVYGFSSDWSSQTTYHCNDSSDGTSYYLDTIDECIEEVYRLVLFEATKSNVNRAKQNRKRSEISQNLTLEMFENAYTCFIEQADKNAKSGKAEGTKVPFGYGEISYYDRAEFKAEYGRGRASSRPYMNWWAVSIYYLPDSGQIILGMEEGRYNHQKKIEIKPKEIKSVGKNRANVIVYYSTNKRTVDYKILYNKFIELCDEVSRLGLE